MKRRFLGLLLILLGLSCSENPTASRTTTATIRNNSDFTVTCQTAGVYSQTFTLNSGESRAIKAPPEFPDALKVTFPNGSGFAGLIVAGDTVTITNSGVRKG